MIYLDSSALVRLVVAEAETPQLVDYLRKHSRSPYVYSSLSHWEVVTAVQHIGPQAVSQAMTLLNNASLVEIQASGTILREAQKLVGENTWPGAIHLASVMSVRPSIMAVASYDPTLLALVAQNGIPVITPC